MRGIAGPGDFPPTIFGKGLAMMKSIIAASVLSLGVASAAYALPGHVATPSQANASDVVQVRKDWKTTIGNATIGSTATTGANTTSTGTATAVVLRMDGILQLPPLWLGESRLRHHRAALGLPVNDH